MGERNGHPNPLEQGCGDLLSEWRVWLELEAPGPGDVVRMRSGRPDRVSLDPGVFATAQTPTVSERVGSGDICTPPMTVEGLVVDGAARYTIRYEALDW